MNYAIANFMLEILHLKGNLRSDHLFINVIFQ